MRGYTYVCFFFSFETISGRKETISLIFLFLWPLVAETNFGGRLKGKAEEKNRAGETNGSCSVRVPCYFSLLVYLYAFIC